MSATKNRGERVAAEGGLDRLLRWRWLPPVLLLGSLLGVYGDVIFAGKGFFLEDLTLYHHPMKKVVRDAVWSGEFPWWNPLVGAGQPLAANPAYELFYPGQWLVLLGNYDLTFQLHIVAHAFLAALGMYLLARSLGLGGLASVLGAVAYGAGGPMLSMTKLLPFMFSMAWAPYVVLFARRALVDGGRRNVAFAAVFAGLQILIGEPVSVLQTWMIIGTYVLWHLTRERVTMSRVREAAGRLSVAVVLAASLASVQILPAVDHARDSVRMRGLTWEVASSWSTPTQRPLEMLFPGVFRQVHDEAGVSLMKSMYGHDVPYIADLYVGLLPVLLALAFLMSERPGRWWVIGGLLILSVLAAGAHLPFFRIAWESGLAKSIRYPEKFLLGIFFVTCVLAAAGAQKLVEGNARVRRITAALAALWLAVALVGAMAGSGVDPAVPESARRPGAVVLSPREYWLLAIPRGALALGVLWGAARDRRRFVPIAVAAAVVLSTVELRIASRDVAPVVDRGYFSSPAVLDAIEGSEGRLYHRAETSWWQDQDAAAIRLLEDERYVWPALMQGAFPLIPTASGVPVVLNDDLDETFLLSTAEFLEVWRSVRRERPGLEPVLWRMAGVEWVGDFDPSVSGDQVLGGISPVRLRRVLPGERAWFATSVDAIDGPSGLRSRILDGRAGDSSALTGGLSFAPAPGWIESVVEHRNGMELTVESEGRSYLVLSVTPHKYWIATVDGEKAGLARTNVGFQGLELSQGRHVVRLRYRNPLVVAGGLLSGLTIAVLLALLLVPAPAARRE